MDEAEATNEEFYNCIGDPQRGYCEHYVALIIYYGLNILILFNDEATFTCNSHWWSGEILHVIVETHFQERLTVNYRWDIVENHLIDVVLLDCLTGFSYQYFLSNELPLLLEAWHNGTQTHSSWQVTHYLNLSLRMMVRSRKLIVKIPRPYPTGYLFVGIDEKRRLQRKSKNKSWSSALSIRMRNMNWSRSKF